MSYATLVAGAALVEAAVLLILLVPASLWAWGLWPPPGAAPHASALLLQAFLVVAGLTVLTLAAALAQGRRVQEELRHAEEKYRNIFENAIEGIFTATPEGRYLTANPALARVYGYDSPEELIAGTIDLAQPAYVDLDRRAEFLHLLEEHGEVSDFESQVYRQDGRVVWISERARPVRDARGRLLCIEGTAEDISARMHAEESLLELLRLAALQADVGVALTRDHSLHQLLGACVAALRRYLDAVAARIWTVDAGGEWLELQSSAQDSAELTGFQNRVRLTESTVGRIAQGRHPRLIDLDSEELSINERDWLRREGIVAAAVYPLLVQERLLGVLAVFARTRFSRAVVHFTASVANEIAVGIDRKRADEALRRSHEELESRVQERTAELAQLLSQQQASYLRLQELESLRKSMVDMIVHDLRTPLTSFLTGLETVVLLGELNVDQQEFLDISIHGGQVLLNMINDILDISKMEGGSLALDCIDFAPDELVDRALRQVNSLAAYKSVKLLPRVAPDLPQPYGDVDKLLRTLVNLLGNAIKFTPEGGSIAVSARLDESRDGVLFAVTDTGEGIPQESFEHIFEKFGQVESRKSGRKMSSGLGLTFCKMVVEAHGGRIWVESEVAKGTTFTFLVPLRPASRWPRS